MTVGGGETRATSARAVELRIPDDPGFLRLARFAASDAASRAGLGLDATDDVRLAVSELCGLLAGSGAPIGLRFDVTDGSVVINGVGAPGPGIDGENGELARTLVEAVVDDLRFEVVDGTATFRITKGESQEVRG
jgi:hypothetical protein